MSRVNVMHLVDTLESGGAERVAVNLANLLPRERYRPFLCATRRGGPLADLIAPDVTYLQLGRRHSADLQALWRLARFIRVHSIDILHAHGTSLFTAAMASRAARKGCVVWHAHFGRQAVEDRSARAYRLLTSLAAGVITVNSPLAEWVHRRLRVPESRIWYIPNFVCADPKSTVPTDLPGPQGARIVCVGNTRPDKDHVTLVEAMAQVRRSVPDAHLILVGSASDPVDAARVQDAIGRNGLGRNVSLLGQRTDVPALLRGCDIGVLSSASEGLPLALLEYGMAGLPAVATRVGQCAEVLDEGRAGLLVPPADPAALADALCQLLVSPEKRASLGRRFHQRVSEVYSADTVMHQITDVYESLLLSRTGASL